MRKNLRTFFMLERNKNETEQEQLLLGRMSPMLRAKVPAATCTCQYRSLEEFSCSRLDTDRTAPMDSEEKNQLPRGRRGDLRPRVPQRVVHQGLQRRVRGPDGPGAEHCQRLESKMNLWADGRSGLGRGFRHTPHYGLGF